MCGYEHFPIISKIVTLCFFVLQRDAEVDDAIAGFVQPQIFNCHRYNLHCGRGRNYLPTVPEIDFRCSCLSHNQSKAILTFLEQALLETGRGQTLVTVSSFFNDLASA